MSILLEIAVGTLDDARAALAGGGDRIELNGGLEVGGLTPSMGVVRLVREEVGLPVVAMVRPRAGGFVYSAGELLTMRRDVDLLCAEGVGGVAFGFLNVDRTIDRRATEEMVRQLGAGREAVFHRAFDLTPDPLEALETLIDLGVTRVLTSGQQASAAAGVEVIERLIQRARGRIEILPGAGVHAGNAAMLVARTGATQLHGSFSGLREGAGGPVCEGSYRAADAGMIRATRKAIAGKV